MTDEPIHHDITQCLYPVCDCVTNGAMPAADNADPPETGDLVICGGCAALLVFDECPDCGGLVMRLPTLDEALMIAAHPRKVIEIKLAQMVVLEHRATHGPPPDTH